tara:strand:+ start:2380 stop:3600 length:1221 start_codon:yes stop_codon:yes gene_type:complete
MRNKLILFTSSYPYGGSEQFLEIELPLLSENFKEIIIYPFYYNNKITYARSIPENVQLNKPLIPINVFGRVKLFLCSLFFFNIEKSLIIDFFRNKIFLSKKKLYKWILILIDSAIIKNSKEIKEINKIKNSVFYFYWGSGYAYSLINIKKRDTNLYFLRLHGGEVYLERNNFYTPLLKKIIDRSNYILAISSQLKKYINDHYEVNSKKIFVSRLGTRYLSKNPFIKSNVYRLVSVSNLIPLKRVNLIIEVLSLITTINIEWFHFGDGVEKHKLIKKAKSSLCDNITFNFMGNVKNVDLLNFYANNMVDVFISVSKFEGIPVSIMEAMSFGIPCIATNAGATSEIVNNNVGELISIDFNKRKLRDTLLSLKSSNWIMKRNVAFQNWNENYNIKTNGKRLIKILKNEI